MRFILKYCICQKFESLRGFLYQWWGVAALLNRSLINLKFCLFYLFSSLPFCSSPVGKKATFKSWIRAEPQESLRQVHPQGQVWAMKNQAGFWAVYWWERTSNQGKGTSIQCVDQTEEFYGTLSMAHGFPETEHSITICLRAGAWEPPASPNQKLCQCHRWNIISRDTTKGIEKCTKTGCKIRHNQDSLSGHWCQNTAPIKVMKQVI